MHRERERERKRERERVRERERETHTDRHMTDMTRWLCVAQVSQAGRECVAVCR